MVATCLRAVAEAMAQATGDRQTGLEGFY